MVPSQSPSRVRTLLSHQLPYRCWLSSEPPLQPSSASFILSSPLHAKRDIRGLGRRWPAILHAVGHNVPIVLSRGRCPGPGERWGDHARPLLSPQCSSLLWGPGCFFPTTSSVTVDESFPKWGSSCILYRRSYKSTFYHRPRPFMLNFD